MHYCVSLTCISLAFLAISYASPIINPNFDLSSVGLNSADWTWKKLWDGRFVAINRHTNERLTSAHIEILIKQLEEKEEIARLEEEIIISSLQEQEDEEEKIPDVLPPLDSNWSFKKTWDGRKFFINKITNERTKSDPRLVELGLEHLTEEYKTLEKNLKKSLKICLLDIPRTQEVEIVIRRDHLLKDAMHQLSIHNPALYRGIKVKFAREPMVDAGGGRREFLTVIKNEIFNINNNIFQEVQPGVLDLNTTTTDERVFFFTGMIFGLSLFYGSPLEIDLSLAFWKRFQDEKVELTDIRYIDKEFYNSMKWIIENDPEFLDLHFEIDEKVNGKTETRELKENGFQIAVTNENKYEYVKLMINRIYEQRYEKMMEQVKAGFKSSLGFYDLPKLNGKMMASYMTSKKKIKISDLKVLTKFSGWNSDSKTIEYFWKVIESFNQKRRRLLLKFITGTSGIPEGIIEKNQTYMWVEKKSGLDTLPTATTCSNMMRMNDYSSLMKMREKLILAIENSDLFGFV